MSEEFIAGLSDKELREKLLAHGASVGPVTGTSRRVLERKLARLMGGNTTQTTPRKPRTKSPARPVVSKPSPPSVATAPRPVENNISRPVENSFSSSISQSRVSDAFSSSRGSLGSSAHASSRGSVGSSAPQSSLLGSIGSSSYDTRKSAYPSLDSTSADRFDSVVGGTVYGGSSRYTDSSPVRPRFEQASPPPSYKKKITTTPPLQRYSARQRETEKRPNVDFQDDDYQYEEDDHMEWSRELSDNESRQYETDRRRNDYLARTTSFDTSFLRKGRANASFKQVKSWYAQNEVLVNSVVFTSLILLTVAAVIHQYPEKIQGGVSRVGDFFSSLVFVGVHYAIIPAATIALVVAILVGGFYGYRYKAQADNEYAKEKRELIEKIIRKVQTSSPDPVAINQLRDDLFPVYRRTKYEEKLWNECETVLLQKDSRIRCDLHRTKDGDTVTAFRWIGTKY